MKRKIMIIIIIMSITGLVYGCGADSTIITGQESTSASETEDTTDIAEETGDTGAPESLNVPESTNDMESANEIEDTNSNTGPVIVSGAEAKDIYESNNNVILLDVRNQDEYDEEHIDGSILIPVGELESRLSELPDKDAIIIVYCKAGGRSASASALLVDSGYKNVYNMQSFLNWS